MADCGIFDFSEHSGENTLPGVCRVVGNESGRAAGEDARGQRVAVLPRPDRLRFIDLFAGIGGIRCGLEIQASQQLPRVLRTEARDSALGRHCRQIHPSRKGL